jgi:hypothetical protein
MKTMENIIHNGHLADRELKTLITRIRRRNASSKPPLTDGSYWNVGHETGI